MNKKNKNAILAVLFIIIICITFLMGGLFMDDIIPHQEMEEEKINLVSLTSDNYMSFDLTLAGTENDSDETFYANSNGKFSTIKNEMMVLKAFSNKETFVDCDYELSVSVSGLDNLYDQFQMMENKSENQLILTVGDVEYDFYTAKFPMTITGTLKNINVENAKDLYASFTFNKKQDIDQSSLLGKQLTIEFDVKNFKCTESK